MTAQNEWKRALKAIEVGELPTQDVENQRLRYLAIRLAQIKKEEADIHGEIFKWTFGFEIGAEVKTPLGVGKVTRFSGAYAWVLLERGYEEVFDIEKLKAN